ncbi:hypothetical protein SAMN04515656_10351 [Eubacterium aggregans]|uniref:Uncharacterized protein n=1 Tax=Eubacterium aggregans TaxID=81409 RepID=A0A1H3Y3U0_9FIRM|nr:DUF6275 family protein [Eubacterium aggregans]SEA06233.1 hypothetical protein SAMN04515656_10351 [Eubacterium aggregans]
MDDQKFLDFAEDTVVNYYNTVLGEPITKDKVFIVWSCKTLQNNKAILATHAEDKLLFELTFNGDKQEAYLDTYDKINNCVVVPREV